MDTNAFFQLFGITFTMLGVGLALIVQGKTLCIDGSARDRKNARARLGRRALFLGIIFLGLSVGWFVAALITTALRAFIPEMLWLRFASSVVASVVAGVIVWVAYVVAFKKP